MFAPGARQRLQFPHFAHSIAPFALGLLAICASIVAWAVVSTRTVTNEQYSVVAAYTPGSIRSVAYAVAQDGQDVIYVRPALGEATPVAIASFPLLAPNSDSLRIRGQSAPAGDRLAVLHFESLSTVRLSLVDLPGGAITDVDVAVDHQSPLAWAHDGSRLAVVRSFRTGSGSLSAVVSEVDATTAVATEAARFDDVLQVAPVGYSLGGDRLFMVVVDRSGSALWVRQQDRVERLWQFSPGRTRDWSLSPDGARLAFVDRIGVGSRTYAGRTLLIATGDITEAATQGDQLGTAWRPGVDIADFGGPAGSLKLTEPLTEEQYLLPLGWSPDGTMLVATIYSAGGDGSTSPQEAIQVLSDNERYFLAEEPGARFLGWVRDL